MHIFVGEAIFSIAVVYTISSCLINNTEHPVLRNISYMVKILAGHGRSII